MGDGDTKHRQDQVRPEELIGQLWDEGSPGAHGGKEALVRALLVIGVVSMLALAPVVFFAEAGLQTEQERNEGMRQRHSRPETTGAESGPPLTFRGGAARRGLASGDYSSPPSLLWRYPARPMCMNSMVGREKKTWCGTGWTGQPALRILEQGRAEVVFGAFDGAVHFVDLRTGKPTRPAFRTADIIKGSVSLDPDGEPLMYFGSRDNRLRIVALDRSRPVELWRFDSHWIRGLWNDDWDSSPLVLGDVLVEGCENGYLLAFELNRDYRMGLVTVSPELLVAFPSWTDALIRQVGDRNTSIESSPAAFGDRVYFANSAGRIVGLSLPGLKMGMAKVVFDFWAGDDVDATIAIDEQGMLYVAAELERYLPRAESVGQLMKLDPYDPENPLVWKMGIPPGPDDPRGGIWSSPAVGCERVYVTTQAGLLLAVDRWDGKLLATEYIGPHAWSSPVLAWPYLLVAGCDGMLRCYRVDGANPLAELWRIDVSGGACIESTPLVWNGYVVVGARNGFVYAFGPGGKRLASRSGPR
ncbi:MAG: hypothetical protein D6806_11030 [Deltaproteobacteria bacterium]|nr:MAG: hypothetical protein D6806_11030 [Deltaproteobacteria bacterium]